MGASVGKSSLLSIQSVLFRPIVTVGLTFLLFGFYALLFGQLIHFLWTRPNVINRRLHIAWVACLFVMAMATSFVGAATTIMDSAVFFRAVQTQDLVPFDTYLEGSQLAAGMTGFIDIGYVVTNCIADSVLIHRLYTICGSTTRAIAFPVLASVIANAFGLATSITDVLTFNPNIATPEFYKNVLNLQLAYYAMNAAVNSMITLMIAGRIWWAARDARRAISDHSGISKEFKTVIAMVLESGIFYPIVLIIDVALSFNSDKLDTRVYLIPGVALAAGIAPTFVILWSHINRYVQEDQLEDKTISLHVDSTQVKETNEDTNP